MTRFHYNGAIVRIRVQNFMTYSDTVMQPGSNLNMILGPNGTGKSAMVCCIIIGLAGEVSLTGRGSSPADFVKKGKDYAITEIELYNGDGPNYIVERKISITDRTKNKIEHKSEWKINSKPCLKVKVQELMKELHIKVDNLCQFLPQDSVTQFVKMNTVELLIDTLKAAGDDQLVDDHKVLVEKTKQINQAQLVLGNLKQSCEENQVNAQRLQSEVQQLEQREQLIRKRKICTEKIFYAKYQYSKEKLDKAKLDGRKLNDELKIVQRDCEPHKKAKQLYSTEELKHDKTIEKTKDQLKRSFSIMQDFQKEISNLKLNCVEESAKFRTKEEEEEARQNNIRLKQQEVESLEIKLADARDIDCTNQINSCERQINSLRNKIEEDRKNYQDCDDKLQNIVRNLDDAKRQHASIIGIKDRKMQLLKNKYPDAFKVVEWLGKNKNRFSGYVSLPLMCEINVKDAQFSSIVEHAISRPDFSAFVCEEREDVTTLSRVARDELNVKINVIMAPDKSRDQTFASQSSQLPNLAEFGIKYFLKDLIDASEPIMKYLYASNNFHRIPVGTGCSEAQIKKLMDAFPRFYNDRSFFNISRSRYDQKQMIVKDTVRDGQHLKYSLDSERLNRCNALIAEYQQLQTKLHEERNTFFNGVNNGKREFNEIRTKLQNLKEKQGEKDRLERLIARATEVIQNMKNLKIDLNAEREILKSKIKDINMQMVDKLKKIGETCDNIIKIRQSHMKALISKELVSLNRRFAEKKLKQTEEDSKRLMERIAEYRASLQSLQADVEEAKNLAETKIEGFSNGKIDDETKTRFDTIEQDSVEALRNYRNDIIAQIDRIQPDTGDILLEFRRQNQAFKSKKAEIDKLEKTIKNYEHIRDQIKVDWRTKLDDVIKVIDKNYQNFMKKLNYGGQVKLDYKQDDVNDFGAYGISIMVRYRDNEDLIPLTSTRQSGGERSVATMIYMLALQTKTTVPFRCVDEINQGMDKDNERKVFELLVDTADSSSSQYFLVSPKLLTNLDYSEKMKIHIVFNGKRLKLAWKVQEGGDDQDENRRVSRRSSKRGSINNSIVKKRRS